MALEQRCSGVLLHPTSLPGPGPHGCIGEQAYRFVAFLREVGFSVWQMLPPNPRDDTGSPYRSSSVFALDPGLLDPAAAVSGDPPGGPGCSLADDPAAGAAVADAVLAQLEMPGRESEWRAFEEFAVAQGYWLDDYALYEALRAEHAVPWYQWPVPLRDRESQALAEARRRHADAIRRVCMIQFLCDRQWRSLRNHANGNGVRLFGDLSFFAAHDSADVWARRELFQLDAAGRMTANTGVPPDYFSATGQLWGMPHYDWPRIAETGWQWWIERLRRQLALFDLLRIDHFRGLVAAWHVPPEDRDATSGEWRPGPGMALLAALSDALGPLPLVAEDLGLITADVERLREEAGLPGMRVLQFAFGGGADNPHLPHNHVPRAVVYTGTHDNNTLAGWWQQECDATVREQVDAYLGRPREPACPALRRAALASVARLAVLPMQDLLGLGPEARLNTPGTAEGNWAWRLDRVPADPGFAAEWRGLNALYGRLPAG